MIKFTFFALFLSLPTLALAGNDGDAVNERIPVTNAELEAHWQVDCADAWLRLKASAARRSTTDHCRVSAELVRELKLCAFIYQTPGDTSPHKCPDYRGVSEQLEQLGEPAECQDLRTSIIANQMNCANVDQ